MKPRTAKETAMICVAALGMVLGFQYLTTRKRAQLELTGGDQYRELAGEYRRLADLAITAQEHTDLKLGDVVAQLDYPRASKPRLAIAAAASGRTA